jgi:hypothetical protein
MELATRNMLLLTISGFGYLCLSSDKLIQDLFDLQCENGEWYFHGESIQIWSEGARSTTKSLVRFSPYEFFFIRAGTFARCV